MTDVEPPMPAHVVNEAGRVVPVSALALGVDEVTARLVELWNLDGPDDLNGKLALLAAAREMVEAAKVVAEYCETDAIAALPAKKYAVEGGEWEKKSGSRRVIRDHETVMAAVTGLDDLPEPVHGAWREMIHVIAGCLPASLAWKVGNEKAGTGLRGRGLDPDLFSEWESGRARLVFTADKEESGVE